MKEYINNIDKTYFAGEKGFDDKEDRRAVITMTKTCPVFNDLIWNYFNLKENEVYDIKQDPYRCKDVDLGIIRVSDEKVMGIIEVGVFNKWKSETTFHYEKKDVLNRLKRKHRYCHYGLPYISLDINKHRNCGILTLKETELKYPETTWPVKDKHGNLKWEKGRQIKLSETIKVGKWAA